MMGVCRMMMPLILSASLKAIGCVKLSNCVNQYKRWGNYYQPPRPPQDAARPIANRQAPGPDRLQNFGLKWLQSSHGCLAISNCYRIGFAPTVLNYLVYLSGQTCSTIVKKDPGSVQVHDREHLYLHY